MKKFCCVQCFVILILQIRQNIGFNFDLNFVDIVGSGGSNDYFGYSVLLQKGQPSQVIVGSPKSNSTLPNYANIREPGVLYRCKFSSSKTCEAYTIDAKGNTNYQSGDSIYHYNSRKDGSMLGATVDGGENVGDPFVVCSPKWINRRIEIVGDRYLLNGMCYFLYNSSNLYAMANQLRPLLDAGSQGIIVDNKIKYYYAMGQVGMSIKYLENTEELLLGAPGVLSWKGTVVKYQTLYNNVSPPLQRLSNLRKKRQVYADINTPNPSFIPGLKEDSTLFGYSVSTGKFKLNSNDIWYVTGAPRGENIYGLVLLYNFPSYPNAKLQVHKTFIGDQLGSYFGSAVLSVDVSRNHADDLLVGAPTYFIKTYDEGCVYYYKNDGEGNFDSPIKIFGNKYTGGRFGTTISSLGDINQDSYQDIAIAAPYEEYGVVYIYLGSMTGLNESPSQKISAKQIDKTLQGFGYSISKGVDIDQNLYNDIAVGAYRSSKVAIIKSRPVVQFVGKFLSSVNELTLQTKTFNITYCLSYSVATDNVNEVDTQIIIMKDPRTVDKSNIVETVKIEKNKNYCSTVDVVLTTGSFDFTKPYKIEMGYTLASKPETEFCPLCPIVDPMLGNSAVLNIPFANGCKNNNVCRPDLKILVNVENNIKSLTIGSVNNLHLNIRVENHGEPSYLPEVRMQLPLATEILQISNKCSLDENQFYTCLVDDALQPDKYKDLVFELDVKKLHPKETNLSFNISVSSKGEEVNPNDNFVVINLPLELHNAMEVSGKSKPDQIVYVDEENKVKYKTVNLTHDFFLKNEGPSPVMGVDILFEFPIQIKDLKNIFEIGGPEVIINNQASRCEFQNDFQELSVNAVEEELDVNQEVETIEFRVRRDLTHENLKLEDSTFDLPIYRTLFVNCSSSDVKCKTVKCTTNDILTQNQDIRVKFMITAYPYSLEKIMKNKDILLYSSTVKTTTNGRSFEHSVNTLFHGSLPQTEVSYWIYIVCVLIGIIILIGITFLLYKCNFFRRTIREKDNDKAEEDDMGSTSAIRSLNNDDVDGKYD